MLTAGSLWEVRLFIQLFLLIFPSLLYFTLSVQLPACCYNLFQYWNLYQANINWWSDIPVKRSVNAGWTIRSCISNTYVFSAAKGARWRCCCYGFFLTQLSRWGFWGSISVGIHSQQSICQATLLIQIIHLPILFPTSRFNQLLSLDSESYFFMKDAGHILRVNVAERRRRK